MLFSLEHKTTPGFENLPNAMWFYIASMTTVGYGDVVPKSIPGKVLSSFSMVTGVVILVHLFLPVYLSCFSMLYEKTQKTAKQKNQKMKPIQASDGETRR